MQNGAWAEMAVVGAEFALRVSARARREEITREAGQLMAADLAPLEDGKANVAVQAMLAHALGVAKSRLVLLQGAASRDLALCLAANGIGQAKVKTTCGPSPPAFSPRWRSLSKSNRTSDPRANLFRKNLQGFSRILGPLSLIYAFWGQRRLAVCASGFEIDAGSDKLRNAAIKG